MSATRASTDSGRVGVRAGVAAARIGVAAASVLGCLALTLSATLALAPAGPAGAAGTPLIAETFANGSVASPSSWIEPSAPTGDNLSCLTAGTIIIIQKPISDCSVFGDDPVGSGTLRLTNEFANEEGGVMTTASIPASQGIDVTFDSYQYGGVNNADGIGFVLAAEDPSDPAAPAAIGQPGGDLGYSAGSSSGAVSAGLDDGYLGVGLDSYGNYSSPLFDGTGCPAAPSWASTKEPGQVVVRGPGNGTAGYCPLDSSLAADPGSTQSLSGSLFSTRAQSLVPVEVVFNPTDAPVDLTSAGFTSDSVPVGDYGVAWTPIGGSPQFFAGPLPTVANGGIPAGLYPSGWLNPSTGIPYQIGFGWVASTGAGTDIHEVSDVVASSIQSVPVLTAGITDSAGNYYTQGSSFTYTMTAGVAAGQDELDPITMSSTLPDGLTPGDATGTGWSCSTAGQTVTCTETGTVPAGTQLPPVTLPVTVAADADTTAGALTTEVTVSSDDGDPATASDPGTATVAPPTPQAITFDTSPPAPAVAGGPAYVPSATGGGSGNPVVFSLDPSTTNDACSVSGGTVSLDHDGTCVIDANQAGGVNGAITYSTAPEVTQSFAVEVGAEAQLAFLSQPGDFTAGGTSPGFEVGVEDAEGDLVTTSADQIDLAATPAPGSGFTGTSATASGGIATFDALSTTQAGTYTLSASSPGSGAGPLAPATSASFVVGADTATQLGFVSEPGDFAAGDSAPSFGVAVEDGFGNVVTTSTDTITLTPSPGAAFTGTSAAAVGGIATFAALSTTVPGTYTLTAGDGTLAPATSGSFVVSAGAPAQLAFLTQPGDFAAGGTSPAFTVAVEDAYGNLVTTSSDTVLVAPGAGGPFTGDGATAVGGIATFDALSTDAPGTYTLTASSGTLAVATSGSFVVSPAAAAQLAFLSQPGDFTAGGTSPTFAVAVEDAFGNVVTTSGDTVSLTSSPVAAFSGAGVAAVDGVATFSSFSTGVAGTYLLAANDTTAPAGGPGSITPAASDSFVVSAGPEAQLAFVTQPQSFEEGAASPDFAVAVEDAYGNVVPGAGDAISLTPTPAATFSGTDATAVDGIAAFAALSSTDPGTYTLTASSGTLQSAVSASFNVSSGAPAELAFTTQPGDFTAGGSSPAFTVSIEDSAGNVVTSADATVTVAPDPGADFTGTSAAALDGVATFPALSTDLAGIYALDASTASGTLSPATSGQFTVSAGAPSQLVFTSQPGDFAAGGTSPAFSVAAEDAFGNLAATATGTVDLAASPSAAFTGTSVDLTGGVADFAALSTTAPGSYTVTATLTGGSGGVAPATSTSFAVGAAAASQLAFVTQPGDFTAGGASPDFTVAVEDAYGNVDTTATGTVDLTPAPAAAFTGTSAALADGLAAFDDLSSAVAGTYTLTAAPGAGAPAVASATSASFVVAPAPVGAYTALSPTRICDTRSGDPSQLTGDAAQCDGTGSGAAATGQRLSPLSPLDIVVSSEFGVPADATAVVVNVTAVDASAAGYVTVYPAGQTAPTASNVNFQAAESVPNLAEIGVGTGGKIEVVSNVSTDVVVDLEGYVSPSTSGAGLYDPLSTPARICDTRAGNPSALSGGAAQCNGGTGNPGHSLTAGTPYPVQVTGEGGVPTTGVSAVVLNVTAADPAAKGYLTAYPAGQTAPTASNLNYQPGHNVANRVIVPVGTSGMIDLVANQHTDAVVDVSGWFTQAGGTGTSYNALSAPVRICDTRAGNPSGLSGGAAQCNGGSGDPGDALGAGDTLVVQVTGSSGLPGIPADARAVVLNLTAIDPTAQTYLSVYPGGSRPLVSDLNPAPGVGQRRANMVVATLSASGTVTIYNYAGTVNLAVDVSGWYS